MRPRESGAGGEIRSQLALELLLNGYAIGGALIIFRCLLKSLEVRPERWVGGALYDLTDPLAFPFGLIPGAQNRITGQLALADATLLALVILFPLSLLVHGQYRATR